MNGIRYSIYIDFLLFWRDFNRGKTKRRPAPAPLPHTGYGNRIDPPPLYYWGQYCCLTIPWRASILAFKIEILGYRVSLQKISNSFYNRVILLNSEFWNLFSLKLSVSIPYNSNKMKWNGRNQGFLSEFFDLLFNPLIFKDVKNLCHFIEVYRFSKMY